MNPQEGREAAHQNQDFTMRCAEHAGSRTRKSSLSRWFVSALDAYPRLDDLATLAKPITQGNRDLVRNQHDHERHHTAEVDRRCVPCDEIRLRGEPNR